jgi:hypothetical protein
MLIIISKERKSSLQIEQEANYYYSNIIAS